jgi:hypothetical protein
VPAGSRDRLERWCRYALRPPVGQDRRQLMPDRHSGAGVATALDRWNDAPGV